MPLHVSSTCAHHQAVKIALHSLWYHHTYRCDDTRGCVMQFWPPDDEHMVLETCRGMKKTYFKTKILCIKLVNYWDKCRSNLTQICSNYLRICWCMVNSLYKAVICSQTVCKKMKFFVQCSLWFVLPVLRRRVTPVAYRSTNINITSPLTAHFLHVTQRTNFHNQGVNEWTSLAQATNGN